MPGREVESFNKNRQGFVGPGGPSRKDRSVSCRSRHVMHSLLETDEGKQGKPAQEQGSGCKGKSVFVARIGGGSVRERKKSRGQLSRGRKEKSFRERRRKPGKDMGRVSSSGA